MVKIPDPVCAGFFPKQTQPRPAGLLEGTNVEEICSVSNCISKGPDGWETKWIHNDLGFYDSESLAWQAVGEEREGFELYAYKIYPLEFDNGEVRPWETPLHLSPNLSNYTSIGIDLVTKDGCSFFSHSALSCNHGAENFPANKFCLIDQVEGAYQACIQVSKGKYEPGPYYLVEVLRHVKGG